MQIRLPTAKDRVWQRALGTPVVAYALRFESLGAEKNTPAPNGGISYRVYIQSQDCFGTGFFQNNHHISFLRIVAVTLSRIKRIANVPFANSELYACLAGEKSHNGGVSFTTPSDSIRCAAEGRPLLQASPNISMTIAILRGASLTITTGTMSWLLGGPIPRYRRCLPPLG